MNELILFLVYFFWAPSPTPPTVNILYGWTPSEEGTHIRRRLVLTPSPFRQTEKEAGRNWQGRGIKSDFPKSSSVRSRRRAESFFVVHQTRCSFTRPLTLLQHRLDARGGIHAPLGSSYSPDSGVHCGRDRM